MIYKELDKFKIEVKEQEKKDTTIKQYERYINDN